MRAEIRSLSGLRGIAACWVVIGHYQLEHWDERWWYLALIKNFYLAVDLFMILSGFVLALTYEQRFTPPVAKGEFARFLMHRLARIYPLYALTTLICIIEVVAGVKSWDINPANASVPVAAVINLLMIQSWMTFADCFNGPSWSLSTEWACNLAFGIFMLALLSASPRKAAAGAAGAGLCLVGLALFLGSTEPEELFRGQIGWYSFPFSMIRCMTEFSLGIYAWRLRARVPAMAVLGRTPALLAMLAGMALSGLLITETFGLDLLFVACAMGVVIGASYQRSWVEAIFGAPVLHGLGSISFSIYLWHIPLMPLRDAWVASFTQAGFGHPRVLATISGMLLTLAVSTLSYVAFEKPSRAWLRRVFNMDPARPAGASYSVRRVS